jgi:hypothetical protein
MAITPVTDRQRVLAAYVEFTYADFTSGTFTPVFELPADAIVVGGGIVIDTQWNSATSAVLDVGTDTPDDDDEFTATQINAKTQTVGTVVSLTLTGLQYTANANVGITVTVVGATTAGAGRMWMEYIREGRADENQG